MKDVYCLFFLLPCFLNAQQISITYGAEKEFIPKIGDTIRENFYGTNRLQKLKYRDEKYLYITSYTNYDKTKRKSKYPLDNLTYKTLTKYNELGNIILIANYDMGVVTGKFKEFHENGKLFQEGVYDRANREGVWKIYNKQGKLVREEEYRKDILIKVKKFDSVPD